MKKSPRKTKKQTKQAKIIEENKKIIEQAKKHPDYQNAHDTIRQLVFAACKEVTTPEAVANYVMNGEELWKLPLAASHEIIKANLIKIATVAFNRKLYLDS